MQHAGEGARTRRGRGLMQNWRRRAGEEKAGGIGSNEMRTGLPRWASCTGVRSRVRLRRSYVWKSGERGSAEAGLTMLNNCSYQPWNIRWAICFMVLSRYSSSRLR